MVLIWNCVDSLYNLCFSEYTSLYLTNHDSRALTGNLGTPQKPQEQTTQWPIWFRETEEMAMLI